MVIVKSKLTGKFLRQHSASANSFHRRKYYQVLEDKKFMASLPATRRSHNHGGEEEYQDTYMKHFTPVQEAISRETHNRMYDADAMEARRYSSVGSALSSIGKWNGKTRKGERHYTLPEHLEIHEIVAGNLCLVNSDDDEETKRRKEKECK